VVRIETRFFRPKEGFLACVGLDCQSICQDQDKKPGFWLAPQCNAGLPTIYAQKTAGKFFEAPRPAVLALLEAYWLIFACKISRLAIVRLSSSWGVISHEAGNCHVSLVIRQERRKVPPTTEQIEESALRMTTVNDPEFWEHAYQEDRARWDLGTPTPVFQRLLQNNQFAPGRMIVLGAGRGHDARLFARHGFTVTAVDFAAEAVHEMRALDDPKAPVDIIQSNIFALPEALEDSFDYLLEYTCFCAIDPQHRPKYADLVARLLKPNGTYIALLFPIWKRNGGPPFAVSPDELDQLLSAQGLDLIQYEHQPADSVSPRREFEALSIFRKGASSSNHELYTAKEPQSISSKPALPSRPSANPLPRP